MTGVADVLAEAVAAGARGPALVTPARTWSYAQLSEAVDARAAALADRGVAPGVVLPVTLEADGEGILTLLALWRAGAVPAPLNPRLTEVERAAAARALEGAAASAQVILWTSGTSGRPRGVALTAENLRASARGAAARLGLGPDDVWLASLSVAHVGGLALVVRSLFLGSTLAAWGRFADAAASALLDGEGMPADAPGPVTHTSLVPTQLLHLLDLRGDVPPPATFRCALVGGAHAPPGLVGRALDAGWPLALTYGMTEMTSQVTTATPAQVARKPGTVGRPLDGVELLVSEDGEVLVRGGTLAAGTLDAPGATREGGLATGAPPLARVAGPDGWYHTGDLGRLDDDGDLWITGRRSDRIVTGGTNVDPHEVEAALRGHPAILDACVVGLPDAEWGEVVAAAVVVVGEFAPEGVGAWLHERLSAAKRPRRWLRVGALPVNANGKVERGAVRRLFG